LEKINDDDDFQWPTEAGCFNVASHVYRSHSNRAFKSKRWAYTLASRLMYYVSRPDTGNVRIAVCSYNHSLIMAHRSVIINSEKCCWLICLNVCVFSRIEHDEGQTRHIGLGLPYITRRCMCVVRHCSLVHCYTVHSNGVVVAAVASRLIGLCLAGQGKQRNRLAYNSIRLLTFMFTCIRSVC